MGVAPALIYADNPGPIPATYMLAPSEAIQVNSVSATFNGAGAASAFLACLSVYSQDDKLVGRFFPSVTFAIGDSGEVTYGPFLGSGAVIGGVGLVFLADVIVAAVTASPITIMSGIPQGFRHLRLLAKARSDAAVSDTRLWLRFNGDSGNNYDRETLGSRAGVYQAGLTDTAFDRLTISDATGANVAADMLGAAAYDILDYSTVDSFKGILVHSGYRGTAGNVVLSSWGQWRSLSAITQIDIGIDLGSFVPDSRFSIYAYA